MMFSIKKLWPLLLILALLGLGYAFGLHKMLSWEWLAGRDG